MEVLINGSPVKEYLSNGKIFIEGRKGSVFSLRLRNNSSERVLFVPTVDGLSVMDGKEGSFDSRGYIVNGYNSVTIDGWRLSNQEVAEFYFSSPEDSYRKRKGMGNNLGSIAVAVFREKAKETTNWPKWQPMPFPEYPYPEYPDYPKKNVPDFPERRPWFGSLDKKIGEQHPFDSNEKNGTIELSAMNCAQCFDSMRSVSQEIGTGFGETKRSEVITVSFDKEKEPDAILEVFYNSRKQLEKMGIEFNKPALIVSEPNSFPAERGYCERPSK